MNLDESQALARVLMSEHGILDWSFAFNRRRRSLGLCYYELRRIELSAPYVVRNEVESVRDTILHEIAHALAGKDAGHGPKWKAIAARIGATPKRCDDRADMPKGRWHARCPSCAREFHRFRRPNRRAKYSCAKCGPSRGSITFCMALEGAA
jgi:predicted SprT family Zn-dependent metalloprotease